MAIFGIDSEEFRNFKAEMNRRLEAIDAQVRSKVTDSEEAARASAVNAAAHEEGARVSAADIKVAAASLESYKQQAQTEIETLKGQRDSLTAANTSLLKTIKKGEAAEAALTELKKEFDARLAEMVAKVGEATTLLKDAEELPNALADTQKSMAEAKAGAESVSNILSHAATRKSEIDDLHKSIFGENVKGADGKIGHVDGQKDHLDKAYKDLADRSAGLKGEIAQLVQDISEEYTNGFETQKGSFDGVISEAQGRYNAVNDQLKSLLPGAMAAGLSAAYEAKVSEEKDALKRFDTNFRWAIVGLITVSLIPFCVDVYLIGWLKRELVEVVKETPRLILSILPLYFPVLWMAYSANKKVNLSKRLIEEYTHKAVLGRTFSGLSNQIDTLPHESAVKEDLRTRLLFTVLQVSAENPGKLITNYKQSDHPIMEALENSAKLSDSVESLAKIPGLGPLARKLTEKSEAVLDKMEKKVEAGLDIAEELKNPAS